MPMGVYRVRAFPLRMTDSNLTSLLRNILATLSEIDFTDKDHAMNMQERK